MLNLDMVGRLHNNVVQVHGVTTGLEYAALMDKLNATYQFNLDIAAGATARSDHAAFYRAGIPVLFFFTGLHAQYHRFDDHVELINAEGGAKIAQMMADAAYEISSWEKGPTFQRDDRNADLLDQRRGGGPGIDR
jgi:Zn-dependent M28 family amino/carboxypeptidase